MYLSDETNRTALCLASAFVVEFRGNFRICLNFVNTGAKRLAEDIRKSIRLEIRHKSCSNTSTTCPWAKCWPVPYSTRSSQEKSGISTHNVSGDKANKETPKKWVFLCYTVPKGLVVNSGLPVCSCMLECPEHPNLVTSFRSLCAKHPCSIRI